MGLSAATSQEDNARLNATDSRGEKLVSEKAADAATDLYVAQERADRRERFERVVRKAATSH